MGNKKSYLEKWYGPKVYTFVSNQLVQNGRSAWNKVVQEKVFRNNRNWLRSERWKALKGKGQSDERERASKGNRAEARDFYRKPGRDVRAARSGERLQITAANWSNAFERLGKLRTKMCLLDLARGGHQWPGRAQFQLTVRVEADRGKLTREKKGEEV